MFQASFGSKYLTVNLTAAELVSICILFVKGKFSNVRLYDLSANIIANPI